MKKIIGFIKVLFAPFKDKCKLQMRLNTAELKRDEYEAILNTRVSMTIMKAIENRDEVERLTKENQKLRIKVKGLKEDLKGEK